MTVAESRDGDCTNAEYFSRKHKGDFEKSVCADITEISVAVPDVNTEVFDDVEFQDSGPAIQLDKDTFLTNLALFYLRMQSKIILPATTIQALIDEFMEVHTNSMTHVTSDSEVPFQKTFKLCGASGMHQGKSAIVSTYQ